MVFESSVNSEGIETSWKYRCYNVGFESSVNSEGIETAILFFARILCLRVV